MGFGPLGDMISSATNLSTTFFGNAQNYEMNKSLQSNQFTGQNEMNAAAREWAEKMSNTAHQREVEDLRKAGLNPILSAGGGGAVTPSVGAGSAAAQSVKLDTPKLDLLQNMLTSELTRTERAKQKLLGKQEKQLDIDNTVSSARASVDASTYGKILYGIGQTAKTVNDVVGALDNVKSLTSPTINAEAREIKGFRKN